MKKKTYTIIKLLDMINKGRVSDIELKKIAMKSGMSRSDFYSSLEILDSLEYIKRNQMEQNTLVQSHKLERKL